MNKSWNKRTHKVNTEINELYEKACEIAVNEVEAMARKILREQPIYEEFIMAMGTYFFKKTTGEVADYTNEYFAPLHSFISEWDDYLKITGHAMRFTARDPKNTHW